MSSNMSGGIGRIKSAQAAFSLPPELEEEELESLDLLDSAGLLSFELDSVLLSLFLDSVPLSVFFDSVLLFCRYCGTLLSRLSFLELPHDISIASVRTNVRTYVRTYVRTHVRT